MLFDVEVQGKDYYDIQSHFKAEYCIAFYL
jgi:hypothetical protein